MNFISIINLLSDRINQAHVIEQYLRMVFQKGREFPVENKKQDIEFEFYEYLKSLPIKKTTEILDTLKKVFPIEEHQVFTAGQEVWIDKDMTDPGTARVVSQTPNRHYTTVESMGDKWQVMTYRLTAV